MLLLPSARLIPRNLWGVPICPMALLATPPKGDPPNNRALFLGDAHTQLLWGVSMVVIPELWNAPMLRAKAVLTSCKQERLRVLVCLRLVISYHTSPFIILHFWVPVLFKKVGTQKWSIPPARKDRYEEGLHLYWAERRVKAQLKSHGNIKIFIAKMDHVQKDFGHDLWWLHELLPLLPSSRIGSRNEINRRVQWDEKFQPNEFGDLHMDGSNGFEDDHQGHTIRGFTHIIVMGNYPGQLLPKLFPQKLMTNNAWIIFNYIMKQYGWRWL